MTLFVLTFLLIYTLMHLLVWWGIRPLVPAAWRLRASLGAWSVLMILAPILARLLERAEFDAAARGAAWIGYLWMGFLWLAFALFTAQGGWNGLVWLGSRRWPALRNWQLVGRNPALLAVTTVALAGTWAFFEARQLQVEEVRLTVPQLPAELSPLRIVQVSDLHLGLINREPLLATVIEQVKRLRPDLLVVTGDLLDAQPNHLADLVDPWLEVAPPLGKFAVVGNHEAYVGHSHSLDYLQAAGFRTLLDDLVTVNEIAIAGVTDPAWGERASDSTTLAAAVPGRVTILLKHRPWVETTALERFTVQLSGHAHRGQIFPFNFLTGVAYPLQDGLYRLGEASWLYTSRGTGTWGPPVRFLAPPEVTLITLTPPPSS
jgi:hypothetical protein